MKIKSLIISLVVLVLGFSSCVDDLKVGDSSLEKQPGVDVTSDTIFNKAEYARRFLWNTYSSLYYGLPSYWNDIDGKMNMGMFETLSDCWQSHLSWDGVNRSYYSGSYSAGSEESGNDSRFGYTKEGCWQGIRKGWIFIEKVDKVPDMTTEEKERLKAEAKVIIASRYFDMFRHFGGLPIADHAWTTVETFQNPRATVQQTLDFMVKLLDEAAGSLPWALTDAEISNWDGRFTKAAAMGLKCKVLLFAASPLFNDNVPYSTEQPQTAVEKRQVWFGGYKPELWTQCLKACQDFFAEMNTQGKYGLFQAAASNGKNVTQYDNVYRTAFRNAYSLRGSGGPNPEILISTRIRYTTGNGDWNYYFPTSCSNGAFTPTLEYVNMFPMSDGTPFDWNNSLLVNKIHTDRDPRLYETILVDGAEYKGRQAELWVGGREALASSKSEDGQFATGYANYKYILDFEKNKSKPTMWPYLRVAELYLIYAEALMVNEKYDEAIAQVDAVRARVGLKGLVVSNPTLNLHDKAVLKNEILRERACELGLEDVRLFDLIRNKMEINFTAPLHGLLTKRADGKEESWSDKPAATRGTRPSAFTYEKFTLQKPIQRNLWVPGNFKSKWYLSAFPPIEVNKNYGLSQNPGW
jgi:starch-binding outer membrane protein, SusD/RagB family